MACFTVAYGGLSDRFGPLEVTYDYAKIRAVLTRNVIEKRAHNLWRYRELLPVDVEPLSGDVQIDAAVGRTEDDGRRHRPARARGAPAGSRRGDG